MVPRAMRLYECKWFAAFIKSADKLTRADLRPLLLSTDSQVMVSAAHVVGKSYTSQVPLTIRHNGVDRWSEPG